MKISADPVFIPFLAAVLAASVSLSPLSGAAQTRQEMQTKIAVDAAHSLASKIQSESCTDFAAFQLCNSACVLVIDETAGAHADGSKATVSGTFETTFKGPMRTFHNVVLIKK